ncbi:HAMP domain-containing histidine kinase [Thermobifida halotolerans]|uniref:histidine kinase n=1 Tax=Thermobifida halotolerans TaxID=483545 RepID=A0AA97M358_9ACTN|nr:HAMP domain-containing sensor histidine kinase [Thermobifida halotolerans]UOE18839.1 HAMP domain-containing histidine kinase [Thermobifida halotolerans]
MRRLVMESAVLLALVVGGALLLSSLEIWLPLSSGAMATLAMFAAATAVAAGFAAELVSRLSEQPSLRRIAAAMMLYGMVVIPTTASGLATATVDTIVVATIRHTATLLTIGLLLLAVAPFDRPRPWPVRPLRTPATGLRGLLIAVVCSFAAGVAAAAFPETAYSMIRSPVLLYGTALLWLNVGLATLVTGVLQRRRVLVWLGFGQLSVVMGHAPRFWNGDPLLYSPLMVPGVRALGTTLILLAVLQIAYRTYQRFQLDRERLAEAEAEAVEARQRLSTQAHELRNALAGVDGAAQLLTMDDPEGRIDRAALSAALSAELNRMRAMLSPRSEQARRESTRLRPLLEQMVLIRRGNGTRIDLTVESDPVVAVPQDVIAQVVTNILANCERHAPGAHVWVEAHLLGDTVRVRVQDDGPGIPPGQEREVMRRGVKGSGSVGEGIGLAVCRELVVEHGGRLRLAPSRPDRPGCVVLIDLPVKSRSAQEPEPGRRGHRGASARGSGRSSEPSTTSTTSIGSGNVEP